VTDDTRKNPSEVSIGETMAAPSTVASSLAAPSFAQGPTRLGGRYEIEGLLGEGGMGTVYRARDVELDERVALKVLRRELVDSPAILARFKQEAKLARRVTHRNVARTFDIGEHEGEKFLTMELVEGESLAGVVARRGRLPLAEVVHIVDEVCAGMAAAHAANVVHRDLKPDNVLMGKDGRIVVTDFGIAHAAAGAAGVAKTIGGIVGTPAYMAPEQVEAATDIDARADLYALGAMIYELLTGERPWPGDAPFVVAAARLIHPPPDPRVLVPSLPAPVAEVVLRCMAKDRAARFASAELLATALKEAASSSGAPSPTLSAPRAPLPPPSPSQVLVSEKAPRDAPLPARTLGLDKTIAVLPFKNGGPKDDEYLADGITDDLIDVLSMTKGLRVRPRGAVAHLRGTEVDARRVGEELGVQVIVEGSVRKTPASIRVNARLVSTSDGFQIWAKRFERPAADLLAVNDEAAHAIASALTVVDAPMHARAAPTNAAAIDLYMRATHEYHKFWREDVVRAVALYEQALELAPNDGTILAACARARVRVAFFGGEGAAEVLALAQAAADRAVAGAPELGESWSALASARMMAGDPAGAVRALRTSLEKSRGLAPAHDLLGRILVEVGLVDEALRHLRTARSIDPSDVPVRLELAKALALLGNWPEATALIDQPVPAGSVSISKFVYRMRFCFWRGEVHPDLEDPPKLGREMGLLSSPKDVIEVLRTRELPEAFRLLLTQQAAVTDPGSRRRTLFFQLNAEVFAYVFEVDHALDAVASAVDAGLLDISWMDRCPLLEAVRKDTRFAPFRAVVQARADRVIAAWTG
jgi:serine/threonine-protein kinase